MKQLYIYSILLIGFMLFSNVTIAQNRGFQDFSTEKSIEGLSIYPNPVTGSKVYITSDKNFTKEVEVYNVLGKKILSSRINGRELDVSELTPGIYILKIKEGNYQATRKLVVR